jgi:DNA mismatch endonuclease (patch repair protein)
MSRVRSKDTKPEVLLRKLLFSKGFRFRLHGKKLPGTPDIVLPKFRTAIFVHGCFWHLHDCKRGTLPETRREWWKSKLEKNRERDRKNFLLLNEMGWRVAVVWECAFRKHGVRIPSYQGWYPNNGSAYAKAHTSMPPTYPVHDRTKSSTRLQ